MKHWRIYWHYREEGNRAGGEHERDAETADEAVTNFRAEFERSGYLNHVDMRYFDASAVETIGDLRRDNVVKALRTLSADELQALVHEVQTQNP